MWIYTTHEFNIMALCAHDVYLIRQQQQQQKRKTLKLSFIMIMVEFLGVIQANFNDHLKRLHSDLPHKSVHQSNNNKKLTEKARF